MIAIGIDVSKSKLDIFYSEMLFTIQNIEKEITKFFTKLALQGNCKIVLESTGKYHRLVHKLLVKLGYDAMVINPFQGRHFAKAMNVLCKTDVVDAKILALYAEKMDFIATPVHTQQEIEMQELARHIEDLKKIKVNLELRLQQSEGFVAKSLKKSIKAINTQIKEAETKLNDLINNDESLSTKCELLESIPGIGHQTAVMLLCYLRELGTLTRKQIAGLSGLATINNDSGTFRGKRIVQGGRKILRANLYMPILGAATQHNKRLKSFYEHLIYIGKDKKVALIACMRKLVIWANSILATSKAWQENHA